MLLTIAHVICENWFLDHEDGHQLLYHQSTSLLVIVWQCAFYLTYLIQNITQNIIFDLWYLIDNLTKWQDSKFNLNFFSIIYTSMYFFFQKCKLNWKEKYLNFVIEYHFNDHSLGKVNSSTLFMNGIFFVDNIITNEILYFVS
jgi:hypothetical protein